MRSTTSGKSTSTSKQKKTQNSTATTTSNNVTTQNSSSNTSGDSTNWSTNSQTGGNRSVSYTDTSGFTPETLALQQKVYNDTGYTPSQAVLDAQSRKSAAEQAVTDYGKYKSNYQAALSNTLNDILNRKSFDYNFNEDALYQNYRDNYERQGKQAAQNAAAAAAALTGGYGNSYAVSAANQANEDYMTALNDKIPELYQLALQRYNNETQDLYNRYNAIGSQEDREFNRYNTERQNLVADRDYAGSDYRSEQNADMTSQQNAFNNALNLLNYRTGLEAKNVTEGSNWSTTTSEGGSHSDQNTTSTSKSTSKSKEKTKQKSTELTNSSASETSSSVTNSTGGSGGRSGSGKSSKGKGKNGKNKGNVNPLSKTTTPLKNIQEAFRVFKEKSNNGREKGTGKYNEVNTSEAYDYLMEEVDAGRIQPSDVNWIYTTLKVPIPKS